MKLGSGFSLCSLLVVLLFATTPTMAYLPAGGPVVDDERDELPPSEAIAKELERCVKGGRPLLFFDVPEGATEAKKKQSVDPKKTLDAFDQTIEKLRGTEYDTPRKVLEGFHREVTEKVANANGHGEEIARAVYETEWGERLVLATVLVQDANGEASPAAIKELIKAGIVDENFGRYMWFARDKLVRTAIQEKVTAELETRHPHLTFEITILDSGSFDSIKSDVDKTPGLQAYDQDGNPVKAFGPGGQVLGGNIDAYVELLYKAFDDLGYQKYGAKNRISKTLDTEFFANDTLLRRLGRAATHASGEVTVDTLTRGLHEHFAALQRNPGPTYQFMMKIVAQVIGRVVEQDVALMMEIADLGARRSLGVAEGDRVAHVLREAVTSVHSPAVRITKADGRYVIRSIGVIEYLETSGLDIRHSREFAVHNALGDLEKLVHKQHSIIDAEGEFHRAVFDGYLQDLAKYIDRLSKDMLNSLLDPDEGGGRLRPGLTDPDTETLRGRMGQFTEKFVPADDPELLRTRKPEFGREYTREMHERLYRGALELEHGNDPRRVQSMLDLFWAVSRASEIALEIKARPAMVEQIKGGGLADIDPRLAGRRSACAGYPDDYVLHHVLQWIEAHEPQRFGDLRGLSTEGMLQRKLDVAKQLYTEAGEKMGVALIREHLPGQMSLWLGPVEDAIGRGIKLELARRKTITDQVELLRRNSTLAGSDADPQLRSLERRLKECDADLELLRSRPEEAKLRLRARAEETMRQFYFQYGFGEQHPRYAMMLAELTPEQRAVYDSMVPLWKSDFETGQAELLARLYKLALEDLPAYGKMTARRLGWAYANLCGIDVDAVFAQKAGAPPGDANAPHHMLKRFVKNNYVHMGLADSGLRLMLILEVTSDLPWEQRRGVIGSALQSEVMLGVPAIGPAYGIYMGYQMGDPVAMAGGALNGANEMMMLWSGASATGLNSRLPMVFVESLDGIAGLGGAASLYLSMARTSVEIVGHMAFDPVRDEYFQLAYRGYLPRERHGLIPTGLTGIDPDWPVVPITEPFGPDACAFVFLNEKYAQMFLDELLVAGEGEAALALMTLAGAGADLDERKITTSFTIDLATDFDALIADAERRDPMEARLPAAHGMRLDEMRANAVRLLGRAKELQRATKERIAADRARRGTTPGTLNVWLLASRQNLALHFDALFRQEVQTLYEALVGDPDAVDRLRAEEAEAWERWQDLSSSILSDAAVREGFDAVMDTPAAYRHRIAELEAAIGEVYEVPWANPGSMLGEYIGRSVNDYLGRVTEDEAARRAAVGALDGQLAALHAFVENRFQEQPGRTHTERYTLGDVLSWYAAHIREQAYEIRGAALSPAPGSPEERILAAQRSLTELELEQGLLVQGFMAMEEIVAPRIAQRLLTDWLAVREPYDDEANAALKFLWHDLDTQQRILMRITQDLALGRRVLPLYQAQRAAWRDLFHAERLRLLQEYKLVLEDQVRLFQRESARMAQLNAELRAQHEAFPGPMDVAADPYIILGEGGMKVGAHARVDHEIYRALEVEVGSNVVVMPWDRIAEFAGRERYDHALALCDLEEKDVLFGALVDVGVTKVTPPTGHEEHVYEELERRSHLLLVPGDRGTPEPELMTRALLLAPLKEGVHSWDMEAATAHEQCDLGAAPLFYHEPLWGFFTPEFPADRPFDWRYVGEDEQVVTRGTHDPRGEWGEPRSCASAPEAPAAFGAYLHALNSGPGVYTLQIRPAWTPPGLFGSGGSEEPPPWEDVESFELVDAKLHFVGFVTEPTSGRVLSEGIGRGARLTLSPPVLQGTHVQLDIEAKWEGWKTERNDRTGETKEVPSGVFHRSASTLTLDLPAELDPLERLVGGEYEPLAELSFALRDLETSQGRGFGAGLTGPVVTTERPPSRALVEDEEFRSARGRLLNLSIPAEWEDWQGSNYRRGDILGSESAGRMRILTFGDPRDRELGNLLRDENALWVVPVYFRFLEEKVYGFAIYGAKAEPYSGPVPEAIADADEDEEEETDDEGVGAEGEGAETGAVVAGGTGGAGDTGGTGGGGSGGSGGSGGGGTDRPGDGGAIDPARVDPNASDVASHIRTWISVAEPPANATVGAQLRYTEWGVQVGTVPGGTISASGPPDDIGANTPEEYVWGRRDALDSVNHCTLGEYVVAQLTNETTSHCTSRYRPRPPDPLDDFGGRTAATARRDALLDGMSVRVVGGDPAPTEAREFTVQAQDPGPGSTVRIGDTVTLRVHSRRPPPPPVPSVLGLTAADARTRVEDAGLQPDFVGGDPAPRAELAFTVQSQDPSAGEDAIVGSPVTMRIFSRYVEALHRVPDVQGLDVATATNRLAAEGLTVALVDGDRATRPEESGLVQRQEPAAGAEAPTGSRVTLRVRGAWVDPLRTVPDVFGLGIAMARQRLEAAGLAMATIDGETVTDARYAHTVASQDPAAGQRVPAGAVVTLHVHGAFVATDLVVTGSPFFLVAQAGVPKINIETSEERKAHQILAELDASRVEWLPAPEATIVLRVEGDALAVMPREKFPVGTRFAVPVTYKFVGKTTGRERNFGGAFLLQVTGIATTIEEVKQRFPDVNGDFGNTEEPLLFSRRDGTFLHTFDGEDDNFWQEDYEGSLRGGPVSMGWSLEMKKKTIELLRGLALEFDCFLATAVYGVAHAPALETFRRFRDRVLLQSEAGARFVALYYRVGPALANRLRSRPALRAALQPLLDGLARGLDNVDMEDPRFRRTMERLLRVLVPASPPMDDRRPPPDFLRHFHPCTPGSPLHSFHSSPATEVSPWPR